MARVAQALGGLPLALAAMGAMKDESRDWRDVRHRLSNASEEDMSIADSKYNPYQNEYRTLFGAFGVSVRTLPDKLRERYRMLAVFQEDATIPDAVLGQLWQIG